MKKIDIYVNPIDKDISHNRNISFNKLERSSDNIKDKINDLFEENKIYRLNCEITFKDQVKEFVIIGRTNNNLITSDKRLIKISDIIDIKKI